jgi:hypothetical protein
VETARTTSKWWGEFEVPHGQARTWRLGPLVLRVSRLAHEWRVARQRTSSADEAFEVGTLGPDEPLAGTAEISRYATSGSAETLRMSPTLPDRSVIFRPQPPIRVLPHQNVTLYVASPLWLRLEEAPHTFLDELPATFPTQTWWGPSTMEGEPCYASRTHGRFRLEDTEAYRHRVLTSVDVQNAADEALLIQRLNVPVRRLSVYAASNGRLWTESVHLQRSSRDAFAELHVGAEPPAAAARVQKLCGARDAGKEHALFRAFGSLFK